MSVVIKIKNESTTTQVVVKRRVVTTETSFSIPAGTETSIPDFNPTTDTLVEK